MAETAWERAAGRPKVSALVLTFNEERHIGACLERLQWCDEIVVVDSFSSDRTPEIARRFDRVRLLQHTYYGAGPQRNWALRHLRHEWILIFDADERCTPELRDELQAILLSAPSLDAYTIHRRVFLLGRRIRFSGWQHDRVVRLVRRGTARYQNRRVHAKMIHSGDAPMLRHSMDHFMSDNLDDYIRRIVKYSWWGAGQAYRDGKRAGVFTIATRSAFRFLRTYVLQLGFLDGTLGLVFCLLQAAGTYMKWSMLWGFRLNEARGIPPTLPDFDEEIEDVDPWAPLPDGDVSPTGVSGTAT